MQDGEFFFSFSAARQRSSVPLCADFATRQRRAAPRPGGFPDPPPLYAPHRLTFSAHSSVVSPTAHNSGRCAPHHGPTGRFLHINQSARSRVQLQRGRADVYAFWRGCAGALMCPLRRRQRARTKRLLRVARAQRKLRPARVRARRCARGRFPRAVRRGNSG